MLMIFICFKRKVNMYLHAISRYYAEYHCAFDLKNFPFDVQRCQMIFRTRTATVAKIKFEPQNIIYSGPVDMIEFSLTNYTITKGTYGKKNH